MNLVSSYMDRARGIQELPLIQRALPMLGGFQRAIGGEPWRDKAIRNPQSAIMDLIMMASVAPQAKEMKLYRGGKPLDLSKGNKRGISTTTNKSVARDFAKAEKGIVEELSISSKAKIAREADINKIAEELFPLNRGGGKLNPKIAREMLKFRLGAEDASIINEFRKRGYDAIDFSVSPLYGEQEIRVINPNILNKIVK